MHDSACMAPHAEKEHHSPAAQERASKQLPGPGQHFSFGPLVPWEQIHDMLNDDTTGQ